MNPIVHVGYRKTATTWFQKRLYPRVAGRVLVPRRQVQEALLGLEVETDALDNAPENRGLGHNALWLGRLLNHLTYRSVLDKRYYLTLMSNKLRSNLTLWLNRTLLRRANKTPLQLLGPRLVQETEARFAVSNRILATALGAPPEGAGLPLGDRQAGTGYG